ncbi:MAG: response regulator [Parvibaculum sp.]|jgi:two-component system chemotaxis response regulator CheY|uniref:response regulator n=1 Tax=Parvibaculum sp. TaxID=2024848 RepID=UPI00284F72FD|nr:response regulator [Parvibaculum sp.]MDR3498100.1 response regulator [Parvibaculum sp.]
MAQNISTAFGMPLKDLDVLIVDDNANMRLLVRTILRSFGLPDARQARDGTTGLAEMERRAPTLIISDWEMAPMNGRDFIRAVRRVGREPLCFVPIIVLTAHASRQLIQEAFDCGATQLLVKPVTPANMLQRIGWVLEDDRPFEQCGDIYRQDMRLPKPAPKPAAQPARKPADDVWTLD